MRIEAHRYRTRAGERIGATFYDCTPGQAVHAAKEVSASRRLGALPIPVTATPEPVHAVHYPMTVDKCREMREAWGDVLKVHAGLAAWFRQAVAEHAAQGAITKLGDATLPVLAQVYPRLNAWLKGDQRVTAKWISTAYRGGGLLADEVGTGKTAGVVAGLVEAQLTGPTLIVCPKISVKAVWHRELTRHTDLPVYACKGSRATREKTVAAFMADPRPFKILVVVAEMLRVKALRAKGRIVEFLGYEYPELFDVTWSTVVVDESHKLLGAMDVVKANLAGEGLKALHYAPHRLKLAVTATPFGKGGRVEALFGTLHWLWPDEYPSRWAWLRRHFEVMDEKVFVRGGRGMTRTVQKVGGLLPGKTEAAFWAELVPRVLRRTMEEVSPDHRGLKNYVEVPCEMDPAQVRQYKAFTENGELAVDGGIITTVGVLDYLTRSRQFANGVLRKEGGRVRYTGESGKLDRLMAHLEAKDPRRKVVIASQFNEYLDAVENRLTREGYTWYRLDGSTSDTAREEMMNAFQGDPLVYGRSPVCVRCRAGKGKRHGALCIANRPTIFLLNGQAGGVSITLDAADELHALDEMYPPEANTQLYGRIFRRGRVHQAFFYLYRSIGTIDQAIAANVHAGDEAQRRLLDGRRGKEYVRILAQYDPNELEKRVPFLGGPQGTIRTCRECGAKRNQWHIGTCTWDGE